VVEPALSGIVNSCILLFPFCVLHLVSANAKGKFMKQVSGFLTPTYIVQKSMRVLILWLLWWKCGSIEMNIATLLEGKEMLSDRSVYGQQTYAAKWWDT